MTDQPSYRVTGYDSARVARTLCETEGCVFLYLGLGSHFWQKYLLRVYGGGRQTPQPRFQELANGAVSLMWIARLWVARSHENSEG